jgi:integrase
MSYKWSRGERGIKQEPPIFLLELLRRAAGYLWQGKASESLNMANIYEISKILGSVKITEITTEMVDELADILNEGRANSTVNNKLSSLSTLLRYAYNRQWIERMPLFPWREPSRTRLRWLKKDEEDRLLSLLPEDVRAFCTILIDTGMRRGELLKITKENLDGDFIRLWPNQTKTKRERSIPLSPRAKALAHEWIPFKMDVNRIRWFWDKAKHEMGLSDDKDFVLHTLRHTAATRMLAATNNLALVKELLGHSNIQTTLKYAHTNPQQLLEAVNRMHGVAEAK